MFINSEFYYDGQSSKEFNISIVHVSGGLVAGQFGINRNIKEEKIFNNPLPYFFGLEETPLTFTLELYLDGSWSYEQRTKIAKWLFKNDYKSFYSIDNPQVIYECMAVGNPSRHFTGSFEGYVNIEFRCNAPYAWSPISTQTYDFSNNVDIQTITLENNCNLNDYIHYPEVEFQLVGDCTGITITNVTNGGKQTSFTGLNEGETIYIDNKKKIIKTDETGLYRYSKFNKVWFCLVYGQNQIQVVGKCILRIRSRFPVVV